MWQSCTTWSQSDRGSPIPPLVFFSSRRSRRVDKKKRKKGRKEKWREEGRRSASSRFRVFPSIILFSILLPFESTRATRSPPPSISLFHIYAPDGIPRGKFSSIVQNGLHYHNLSDGTPTLPRGLGGFNVIINQNPRWWRCGEYLLYPIQSLLLLSPLIIRDFDYIFRGISFYYQCVLCACYLLLFLFWKR